MGHTCANLAVAASVFEEQRTQYFRIVKCNAQRSACLKDPVMRCWRAHQMVDFALDSDPPQLHSRSCGGFLGPGSTPSHSRGQAKGSRVLVLPGTMDHIKGLGGKAAAVCARLLCLILLCGLVRWWWWWWWWWGHESQLHQQAGLKPLQPRELRRTNPAPVR